MARIPSIRRSAQIRTIVIDQGDKPVRGAVATVPYIQSRKPHQIRMPAADGKGNSVHKTDSAFFVNFRKTYDPKGINVTLGHTTFKVLKTRLTHDRQDLLIIEITVNVEATEGKVDATIIDQFGKPVRGAIAALGYDLREKVQRVLLPASNKTGIATLKLPKVQFDIFRKGYRRGDIIVTLGKIQLKTTKTRTTRESNAELAVTVTVFVAEPDLPVQSIILDQNGKPIGNAVAKLSFTEKDKAKTLAMPATNANGLATINLAQSRFEALRKNYKTATIKQGNKTLQLTSSRPKTNNARQLIIEHIVRIEEPKREMRAAIVDQDGKKIKGAQLSSKYKFGKKTKTMTLPPTNASGIATAKFDAGEQYAIRRDYKNPPSIKLNNKSVEVISSKLEVPSPELGIITATIRTVKPPEPEPAKRDVQVIVSDQNNNPVSSVNVTLRHFTSGDVEAVLFNATDVGGHTQQELSNDEFQALQKNYLEPPSVERGDLAMEIIRSQRTASTDQMMQVTIIVRVEPQEDMPPDNEDNGQTDSNDTDAPTNDNTPPNPDSNTTEEVMNSKSAKRLFRFNAVRPISHKPDNKLGIEYQGELTAFLKVLQTKSTKAQAVSIAADEEAKHSYFDADRLENTEYWPFISAMKRAYLLRGQVDQGIDHIKSELEDAFADHATRAQLNKIADNPGVIWDQYIICILLTGISGTKHAGLVDTIKAIDLYKHLNSLNSIDRFLHSITKMPVLPSWLIKIVGGSFKDTYPFVMGITDLLVVKEDWIGYQRAEIAHIENVMATETRTTTRRSLDRTETTTTYETERIEEAMKETSTSIHSAMSQEIESTISQSSALAAGVNVSASYGPSVSVDTNASFDFTTSSEETTNSAQEYAQDLVERAVTNVSNRERNETVTVVLAENEDTHEQTFTNTDANAEHVVGVYRHIDQIWQAQVFNYGKRLMLDFVVPEPSINWRLSQKDDAIPDEQLVEPAKLDLDPAHINVGNYQDYANEWGATNVPAPPDSVVSVSKAIELEIPKFGTGEATSVSMALGQLQIPDGYRGTKAYVNFFADSKKENNDNKDDAKILINGSESDIETGTSEITLQNHIGTLEFGVYIDFFEGGVASVKVDCAVSPETWANWQNDVYDALKAANDKAIDAYNAAKKNKDALKAVQQETLHPDIKSSIQKNELKRAVISIMNEDNFEDSGSVDLTKVSNVDFAEVRFNEAKTEGAHARFFEEAFEWREMTYLFYPYFWARREEWYRLMNERDPDFNFNAFLQSGAARVNLAVRPGFEAAVMWFFATGEVWNGGPTPMVGDPLYVALIDEVVEAKGRDLDKPDPVGDPWTYSVPTSLIVLDPDDSIVPPPDGSLVKK